MIGDPRVRGVSLTGSERAGAAVAEIAGRNLKKVVLELGGSDPFILLSTDDLDAAVENAVAARVDNTGQSCNAAKRFIVVDDLYEPFLEKFTAAITAVEPGDPTKAETEIGPLSSSSATERLADQLKRALDNGAKLVAGGEHDGNFFQTTVLTDIGTDNPARHEEFFGPVAQVYRVSGEEEAVELANDTPYGLGSYLMTTDAEQARAGRGEDRGGHGVRQPRRRRRRGAAVRRRQELRLRPRARPLRHRRVREQEADPDRLRPALVEVGPAPRALDVAAALLALHPALLARPGGPRLRARAADLERVREPGRQPLERQLAVAVLGARVLRRRGHPRPELGGDARALLRATSVALAATSNTASTREAVTLAC